METEHPAPNRGVAQIGIILGLWLVLRMLTSIWAALVSPLRPLSELERLVPLWPPSSPMSTWLDRTLLAPWYRWDVGAYANIVSQGYRLDDGTAQFHPLFPWLAKPLELLTGHAVLALLIISSLATIGLIFAFERLARLDLTPTQAQTSTLLFLFFPVSFIFFAPYTESLFLVWSVLCFYWARKQAWGLAGLAGMLATLTRQQGLFLLVPLVWELWEAAERDWQQLLKAWRTWLSLALIPVGLLIWIIYRAVMLNDFDADMSSVQAVIYSVIISPSSSQVVPQQAFIWPWQALWLAIMQISTTPDIDLGVNLILAVFFLWILLAVWKHLRLSYRLYTIVIILVSFAYHTGPIHPYMGLPRHLLVAFPVFIGLGAALTKPWQRMICVGAGLVGAFFLVTLYVIEGWVP